ncbi:MAG TPA: glucose-6-phosphate isomerase, partial [Planctomycetota bacterium]|nr:glucose-6-phosphate isomerase [Planctomycetota bacterium]
MAEDRYARFRDLLLDVPKVGLSIDLSACAFPSGFFERMEPKMREAYAAMDALERGAVANPDEKRQVGHYWLRAPELAPDPAVGRAIVETKERILAFARSIHERNDRPIRNVLVVGIGGSALGPQLASAALGAPSDPIKPFFFDNTDPDGFDATLARIEASGGLGATLTVVISKSGGTKETRNGMLEAAAAYRRAGLRFEEHAVAVTQEGSELDRVAVEGRWLERFPMWDWVGGRTSELSAVGLVPAALQGLDVEAMLAGAKGMDEATRVADTRRNPAARLAIALHHCTGGRGKKDMVVLPYKDRLLLFSRYLQQLVMESLGKQLDLQ